MKKLIILLAVILPGMAMAQMNEAQMWENARYNVLQKGAVLMYTDVNAIDSEFAEQQLETIKANMFKKEGIVKVEFLSLNKTIRVYHYDYIELETVKSFVLSERRGIEVMNQVVYDL